MSDEDGTTTTRNPQYTATNYANAELKRRHLSEWEGLRAEKRRELGIESAAERRVREAAEHDAALRAQITAEVRAEVLAEFAARGLPVPV